ncbi:MAG TPA: phosphotransferase [Candidatus Nanoarchaeia archaeon]|nr:phosphotransferase [Candidatus Nanoarchaeia archaeon]
MQNTLSISLKELLGEKGYWDYLEQVISPELERLATTGTLTPTQAAQLAGIIQQQGPGVLEPRITPLDVTTFNTVTGGYLLEATLPLTETVTLHHIIKQSSTQENFQQAIKLQAAVAKALAGTTRAHAVPHITLTNPKRRIMITPTVAGKTLQTLIAETPNKEALLQQAIADYATTFTVLNQPAVRSQLHFPETMEEPAVFFRERYSCDQTLLALLATEFQGIGVGTSVIHGDLHGRNIIITPQGNVYLDWERAASNGSPEFDLGKLLTKANITHDLERRLVTYAATFFSNTPKEQETFEQRYTKNQILQELLSAQRYLERSKDIHEEKEAQRLHDMANVWYNLALRRTAQAVTEGIVTPSFAAAIKSQPPSISTYTVSLLSDAALQTLQASNNPLEQLSQENLRPTTPLLTPHVTQPEKSIQTIRDKIRHGRRNSTFRKIVVAAGLAAGLLATGAGVYEVNEHAHKKELEHLALEDLQRIQVDNYRYLFRTAYERAASNIMDSERELPPSFQGLPGISKEKLPRLEEDSPKIEEVAQQYELEPALLRRILRVNDIYGKNETSSNTYHKKLGGVTLLDPIKPNPIGIPNNDLVNLHVENNLSSGTARLAVLIKKHEGDILAALIQFYTPQTGHLADLWGQPEFLLARKQAITLAYNAFSGYNTGSDFGLQLIYLKDPPQEIFDKYLAPSVINLR